MMVHRCVCKTRQQESIIGNREFTGQQGSGRMSVVFVRNEGKEGKGGGDASAFLCVIFLVFKTNIQLARKVSTRHCAVSFYDPSPVNNE